MESDLIQQQFATLNQKLSEIDQLLIRVDEERKLNRDEALNTPIPVQNRNDG